MKKNLLAVIFISIVYSVSGQGQFAGAKTRPLIGKTYNNDRVLPGLPDYEYREVTLASDENDPEQFSVCIFQKGPTYVVLFTHNKDTTTDDYTVLDVLVIKQVKSNQVVKASLCRQSKISNLEIVAVTQPGDTEFSPALRAWRFNRDKRRFEIAPAKNVDCMNEDRD